MKFDRSAAARGAIGGALAATAIVLFFLIVDALEGRPLETPAFLASVLFGREELDRGVALIAGYTVLHYAVFVALGAVVAWALDRSRTPPALLLGIVVGFLLFDIVFYASIAITGVDVVRRLGWPSFLAGNLVAGLVLMGYLKHTWPTPVRRWRDALREHRTVREGLIAGLIGAATVAVWFFLIDAVLARAFFTPGALGSALFEGVDDPAAVRVTAGTVLGYTVVHVAAFLATGLVFSALLAGVDRSPPMIMGLLVLFVTFETLAIGVMAIVASWLLDVIPWWSIVVANLIAAAAMGAYLWKKHPHLARDFERAEGPEKGAGPGEPVAGSPGPRGP